MFALPLDVPRRFDAEIVRVSPLVYPEPGLFT